jgi:hypothetical protein
MALARPAGVIGAVVRQPDTSAADRIAPQGIQSSWTANDEGILVVDLPGPSLGARQVVRRTC